MPRPSMDRPEWKRQCVRVKANGERCRKYSIRGATVCYSHGGSAAQVRKRADARIEEARLALGRLVPKAVKRVERLLDSQSPEVSLRAAMQVLDRSGLSVVHKSEVTRVNAQEGPSVDDQIDRLIERRRRAEGR